MCMVCLIGSCWPHAPLQVWPALGVSPTLALSLDVWVTFR